MERMTAPPPGFLNRNNRLMIFCRAGKRGAFRASDHDATWSDDSWTLSQMGPNNPKKLKKSKSKDESSQGSVASPLMAPTVQ